MATDLAAPILTGAFALAGGLGGVLLTGLITRRNERRRLAADDERRWLNDRRQIYVRYLTLAQEMHRELDSFAVFLSYDGRNPVDDENEKFISDGLLHYFGRWEDELQPILSEVQLMATPPVTDLADRVSGALMEITTVVEKRGTFISYYPGWFQTQDLIDVLRNAMRVELGLPEALSSTPHNRDADWPWLSDRPPRESYSQHDVSGRHISETGAHSLPRDGSALRTHESSQLSQSDAHATSGGSIAPVTRRAGVAGWRWIS
ncbi:hypothetical protein [Nonomuraea angiospora]